MAIVVHVVQQLIAVGEGTRCRIELVEGQLTKGGSHHTAHQISHCLASGYVQGGARNRQALDIIQTIAVTNAEGAGSLCIGCHTRAFRQTSFTNPQTFAIDINGRAVVAAGDRDGQGSFADITIVVGQRVGELTHQAFTVIQPLNRRIISIQGVGVDTRGIHGQTTKVILDIQRRHGGAIGAQHIIIRISQHVAADTDRILVQAILVVGRCRIIVGHRQNNLTSGYITRGILCLNTKIHLECICNMIE